jgi:hypothetical protein
MFAANHRCEQTSSLLLKSGCTPNHPAVMLPSPQGGEGSCSADPTGRSTLPATPCRTPPTSPPPGLRAGWPCSMRLQLYLPSLAWPLTALTPRSPGEWSEPVSRLGSQLSACSSPRSSSQYPTRHLGLMLLETGNHRALCSQLQPQLLQHQPLLTSSPYTSDVCATV